MIRGLKLRSFAVLLLSLTASGLVYGQSPATGPVPAATALPPVLDNAVEQILNVKFDAARTTIAAYINAHPREPVGYIVQGMLNEWDQVVNNKKKALNGTIIDCYQRAVDYGEAELEQDPTNIDKMIMLGNAHMYLAKKLVDNGSKMSGGFQLKKAKVLMLEAIAKEPDNYNAYMALGVFNYFSENVPHGFKWLATILGFVGSKTDGLNYLKKAAENKNLTQGDAAFLLVYIYGSKEKDYATALQYNAALKARYPDNPSFQYETGELQFQQKSYPAAVLTETAFLDFCTAKGAGYCSTKYIFMANHVIAKSHIKQNNLAAAEPYIAAALKSNEDQYKDRTVDLDLWQGMMAKAKGDNAKAEAFFQKVTDQKSVNSEAWATAQKELAGMKLAK